MNLIEQEELSIVQEVQDLRVTVLKTCVETVDYGYRSHVSYLMIPTTETTSINTVLAEPTPALSHSIDSVAYEDRLATEVLGHRTTDLSLASTCRHVYDASTSTTYELDRGSKLMRS